MPKVSGSVYDDQRNGLQGVLVSIDATRGGKSIYETTYTDAKGAYSFGQIQAGAFSVDVPKLLDLDGDGAPEWEIATAMPFTNTVKKGAPFDAPPVYYRPSSVGGMVQKVVGTLGDGVKATENMFSYPTLTQELAYASSATAASPGWSDGASASTSLARVAEDTLRGVLGWRPKENDPRGFVGALTQAFELTDVDGHVEWSWSPRTYAVQTDLAGGISGAQASLHIRANEALGQALPLLEGLYPLRLDADSEDSAALTSIVSSHWTALVDELGLAGGPRVSRVDQIFTLLLGPSRRTSPDRVGGELGKLRDEFGFRSSKDLVNTLEEEQDLTNFRILTDYTTGLRQTWDSNRQFFTRQSKTAFFGTQLVLLSRQLSVVGESVDEVRFAMNSVYLGPSERQTTEIVFLNGSVMFVEELLSWVQDFSTHEGPRLIQDGGKFAVQNSFLPVAQQLDQLVTEAADPTHPNNKLPSGYRTGRVKNAWKALGDQLNVLVQQATKIEHRIPSQP